MSELLFDTPWWLPAVIAAAGVVLFVTGNRRVENRLRLAGVSVICIAILLTAVSYFVDTPRETAERRSRELVDAFERGDFPAMAAILHPTTAVTVLNNTVYASRDQIIENAKEAYQRYGFKSVNVLISNSEQVQTTITVTMTLLSEQSNAYVNTLTSEWQFEWKKTAEGWILTEVRALKIGNASGEQAQGMFPKK
jgi:hypothetical protein